MKELEKKIRKITDRITTSDPWKLAKSLDVVIQIGDLGSRYGCYMYLKKHKCIFINENLSDNVQRFVLAHELGHALMHTHTNCSFIRNHTLFGTDKIENEANMFAFLLLFGHKNLDEYTEDDHALLYKIFEYDEKIINVRWDLFNDYGN